MVFYGHHGISCSQFPSRIIIIESLGVGHLHTFEKIQVEYIAFEKTSVNKVGTAATILENLVDLVVFSGPFFGLYTDEVSDVRRIYLLVIDLHRSDRLGEIARMSLYVNRVSGLQTAGRYLYPRGPNLGEEMHDFSNFFKKYNHSLLILTSEEGRG